MGLESYWLVARPLGPRERTRPSRWIQDLNNCADEWLDTNSAIAIHPQLRPLASGKIGASAYNQELRACHGLEAISAV